MFKHGLKSFLMFVALVMGLQLVGMAAAQGTKTAVVDLITDPYPVGATQPVSCKLYLGAATTPLMTTATVGTTQKNCLFTSVTIGGGQQYTATGVNSAGIESDPSIPFVVPGITAPTNLHTK